MKAFSIFLLSIFLLLPNLVQSQLLRDSFKIAHVSNGFTVRGNWADFQSDTSWEWRGNNYIIKAWLFPGNYFDLMDCPETIDCGIRIDTILDVNGEVLGYEANPEDTTIIIGDWDCRGFVNGVVDFGILDNESQIGEHSTQTFSFKSTDVSGTPCHDGCLIVTDGPLHCIQDTLTGLYHCRTRVVSGGTDKFNFSTGEATLIISEDGNIAGWPNLLFNLDFSFVQETPTYLRDIEVSMNRHSMAISGAVDSVTGLPVHGSTLILEGAIYPAGTLSGNPDGGLDADGNPTEEPIGTWTARGWWISDQYDLNDGFFVAGKQVFEFDDPDYGHLEIMTDSKDRYTLNETSQSAITGTTGPLFGHKGQSYSSIIGKNPTGGWNFSHSLATAHIIFDTTTSVTAYKNIFPFSLQLYPNPASDIINVSFKELSERGPYTLILIDAMGRLVQQKVLEPENGDVQTVFSLTDMPKGWYSLIVKKDGHIRSSKGFTVVR